jgi:mono/diheme cytochrome c family protein
LVPLTRGIPPLAAAFATAFAAAAEPEATSAQIEFFEREVRPVLAEHCYGCHGPEKQKSGLRLDSRAFVLKGGEGGPVVVHGKPEESRLIWAINHTHGDKVEPMPGDDEKLPPAAIAALTEWVRQGLPWPKEVGPTLADPKLHWAYQPVGNPPLPKVKDGSRARAPLDRFLLSALEKQGLGFAPEAPREVQVRRLYLTLWGLAPTEVEVSAFMADTSPNAYERLVDRLMAAPHFGERWGRHWLDVARYSDTKGYVFEEERRYPYAYTYRDWVVDAFNRDLPYDRFLQLQIAADRLVKGDDNRDLAAMGFLTLGRRFLNNTHDIIDDRIDVVMRGTQAITLSCARCHDHKTDPFPATDYYALHAIFASSAELPEKPLLKPFQPTPETARFERELAEKEAKIPTFRAARLDETLAPAKTALYLGLLRRGLREPKADLDQEAKRLALYPVVLAAWKTALTPSLTLEHPLWGAWTAVARAPDAEFPARLAAALANPAIDPALRSTLAAQPPKSAAELDRTLAELLAKGRTFPDKSAVAAAPWHHPKGPGAIAPDQLVGTYSTADIGKHRALQREVEAFKATSPHSPPRAMVLVEGKPRDGKVLLRGNPNRPGKEVPRRYVELLTPPGTKPFTDGSGRLELARALTAPDNPLTARVMVNRVFNQVFGQSLVETPSDFGIRTPAPRHPELLDHLAHDFVAQGWSIKKLIRSMVVSSAFRQSSALSRAGLAKDPGNELLWRMNRSRLDFESMRDSMLRMAGRLDGKTGGQPFDLAEDFGAPRRTVYAFIERQNLPAFFRTFDFANPDFHVAKRNVTTTPQQALWLLNHPFVRDMADRLAASTAAQPDPAARVRTLYRATLSRAPTPEELSLALSFTRDFAASPPPSRWRLGTGSWDPASRKVTFTEMTHRKDGRVSPAAQFPAPVFGHAFLSAQGGHPGDGPSAAVIRRWQTGPAATARIEGTLHVPSATSQGVRARIVSSRSGLLGEWTAKGGATAVEVILSKVALAPGETIDFIVDDWNGPNSDSFSWSPLIRDTGTGELLASAAADFARPAVVTQDAWSALAQVLLQSNEFNFAD